MRRRSGGFHSDSIEEFIEAQDCLTLSASPLQQFSDIDAYLHHQQHLLQTQTHAPQPYFFSEIDQMLAEESDELSLGCRTHDLVCLQIGLICQQLPACYEYLLSEDHVLEAFNWLYHGRARAGQEFEVEVTDHVVNIIAKPGSGKAEACPKEVGEARSRRAKEERKGKKDETLSRTNVGATALRSDIELIVYYNSPSTQSQTQSDTPDAQERSSAVQLKLWLIQEAEAYSPLLQAYIGHCDRVLSAQMSSDRLQLAWSDKEGLMSRSGAGQNIEENVALGKTSA